MRTGEAPQQRALYTTYVATVSVVLILLLASCNAPPADPWDAMEEAHQACEQAFGGPDGAPACLEARQTSKSLLIEREEAVRVACSGLIFNEDWRSCAEAQQAHLDVLVARQNHLDTLYGPDSNHAVVRPFLDARQTEMNALARLVEAMESGDEGRIDMVGVEVQQAQADTRKAVEELGDAIETLLALN